MNQKINFGILLGILFFFNTSAIAKESCGSIPFTGAVKCECVKPGPDPIPEAAVYVADKDECQSCGNEVYPNSGFTCASSSKPK